MNGKKTYSFEREEGESSDNQPIYTVWVDNVKVAEHLTMSEVNKLIASFDEDSGDGRT